MSGRGSGDPSNLRLGRDGGKAMTFGDLNDASSDIHRRLRAGPSIQVRADPLAERGLGEALLAAIARGTPYLGICLGMQIAVVATARKLAVLDAALQRHADVQAPLAV